MSGYQNNPEATAEVIDKDGFFDTGALFLDVFFAHCFRFNAFEMCWWFCYHLLAAGRSTAPSHLTHVV